MILVPSKGFEQYDDIFNKISSGLFRFVKKEIFKITSECGFFY